MPLKNVVDSAFDCTLEHNQHFTGLRSSEHPILDILPKTDKG